MATLAASPAGMARAGWRGGAQRRQAQHPAQGLLLLVAQRAGEVSAAAGQLQDQLPPAAAPSQAAATPVA